MKKTSFFKLLMVGAMALTVGLTSCNKGPSQDDFDKVCERVSTLENDVATIKNKLTVLGVVEDIKKDPQDPYKLNVTYTNGNSAVIDLPRVPTSDGPSFITVEDGKWYIDGKDTGINVGALAPRINTEKDGEHFWEFPVLNDKNEIVWKAGPKAIAAAYAVNNDGAWTLYLPSKDHTKLQAIALPSVGAGGLAKIDILGWVTGYTKASDNIATTERNADDDSGTIDATKDSSEAKYGKPVVLHNTAADADIFWVNYAWIDDFDYDEAGYQTAATAKKTYTTQKTTRFTEAAAGKAAVNEAPAEGELKDNAFAMWNADKKQGKIQVEKKMVLNTLAAQRQGFIVQVHPVNTDITNVKFEIVSSAGNVLPIGLGTPEFITGLLTRATAQSALYFLPGANVSEKFEAPVADTEYPSSNKDYQGRFVIDARYALNAVSGSKVVSSEYTKFTFMSNPVVSKEAPIEWIVKTDEKAETIGDQVLWQKDELTNQPAKRHIYGGGETKSGLVNGTTEIAYVIEKDNWYMPTFDVTNDLPDPLPGLGAGTVGIDKTLPDGMHRSEAPGGATDAVIDWYLDLVDTSSDYDIPELNQNKEGKRYIEIQFGLEFNETRTAFRVTRLPDNLTLAWFDIVAYKLGVDGNVYKEVIRIRPVRNELTTPIYVKVASKYYTQTFSGEYPILDWNYTKNLADFPNSGNAYGTGGSPYNGEMYPDPSTIKEKWLSTPMIVDLTPMFDQLSGITDDEDDKSNYAQRWQNDTYGVESYKIRKIDITDSDNNVVTIEGPFDPTAAAAAQSDLTKVLLNTDTDIAGGAGAAPLNAFGAQTGNNGVGTIMSQHNKAIPAANNISAELKKSKSFVLQPQYTVDGTPLFQVNHEYKITVDFFDFHGDYFNTIEILFTPVIPEVALIEKDPYFWNSGARGKGVWNDGKLDVLNAFYKVPQTWAEGIAPNGTRYDIALNGYGAAWADGNAAAGLAGGDGGFKKLGMFQHTAYSWATLKYAPKYGKGTTAANAVVGSTVAAWNEYNAPLRTAITANSGNTLSALVYPTTPATGTATGAAWAKPSPLGGWPGAILPPTIGTETVKDVILTLQEQYILDTQDKDNDGLTTDFVPSDLYQTGVAQSNYYGEIFHMDLPATTKYLDVYSVEDLTPWEFNMRILSEVKEGWISIDSEAFPAGVITVPAATGGKPSKLGNIFAGHTYNGKDSDKLSDQTAYSLMKVWKGGKAVYEYNYIDRVEFAPLPEDENLVWWLVDSEDNQTPTYSAVDATATVPSHLLIQSGSTSLSKATWMIVKVYDRFGKVLTEALPIDIIVSGLAPTNDRGPKPTF